MLVTTNIRPKNDVSNWYQVIFSLCLKQSGICMTFRAFECFCTYFATRKRRTELLGVTKQEEMDQDKTVTQQRKRSWGFWMSESVVTK